MKYEGKGEMKHIKRGKTPEERLINSLIYQRILWFGGAIPGARVTYRTTQEIADVVNAETRQSLISINKNLIANGKEPDNTNYDVSRDYVAFVLNDYTERTAKPKSDDSKSAQTLLTEEEIKRIGEQAKKIDEAWLLGNLGKIVDNKEKNKKWNEETKEWEYFNPKEKLLDEKEAIDEPQEEAVENELPDIPTTGKNKKGMTFSIPEHKKLTGWKEPFKFPRQAKGQLSGSSELTKTIKTGHGAWYDNTGERIKNKWDADKTIDDDAPEKTDYTDNDNTIDSGTPEASRGSSNEATTSRAIDSTDNYNELVLGHTKYWLLHARARDAMIEYKKAMTMIHDPLIDEKRAYRVYRYRLQKQINAIIVYNLDLIYGLKRWNAGINLELLKIAQTINEDSPPNEYYESLKQQLIINEREISQAKYDEGYAHGELEALLKRDYSEAFTPQGSTQPPVDFIPKPKVKKHRPRKPKSYKYIREEGAKEDHSKNIIRYKGKNSAYGPKGITPSDPIVLTNMQKLVKNQKSLVHKAKDCVDIPIQVITEEMLLEEKRKKEKRIKELQENMR